MIARKVEATAPCQVNLGGGELDATPADLLATDAVAVSVAIDRRAWCRVETGVEGVLIESKDTPETIGAADVEELLETGRSPLVARILQGLGVESGLRVQIQSRVPIGAGLGERAALGAAVGAAVSAALGRETAPDELLPLLRHAEGLARRETTHGVDYPAALRGGVVGVQVASGGLRVESLAVDPARVEESLLLLAVGDPAPPGAAASPDDITVAADSRRATAAAFGGRVRDALVSGRFEDVVGLWDEEWEARRLPASGAQAAGAERLVSVIRGAGGAARTSGDGSVMAVWAPPGEGGPGRREAVLAALESAGLKVFPARVDLRGLDVT